MDEYFDPSGHIQVLVCKWLSASSKAETSKWFTESWDIFIGMIPYNQVLESKWRLDSVAISQGYQGGSGIYMAGMLKTMRLAGVQSNKQLISKQLYMQPSFLQFRVLLTRMVFDPKIKTPK
jgi:hypothetical protein